MRNLYMENMDVTYCDIILLYMSRKMSILFAVLIGTQFRILFSLLFHFFVRFFIVIKSSLLFEVLFAVLSAILLAMTAQVSFLNTCSAIDQQDLHSSSVMLRLIRFDPRSGCEKKIKRFQVRETMPLAFLKIYRYF